MTPPVFGFPDLSRVPAAQGVAGNDRAVRR